jgi:hypothetical protein
MGTQFKIRPGTPGDGVEAFWGRETGVYLRSRLISMAERLRNGEICPSYKSYRSSIFNKAGRIIKMFLMISGRISTENSRNNPA